MTPPNVKTALLLGAAVRAALAGALFVAGVCCAGAVVLSGAGGAACGVGAGPSCAGAVLVAVLSCAGAVVCSAAGGCGAGAVRTGAVVSMGVIMAGARC